ncbi:universal stress protein [Paeniglutamicibacter sp. R2-26]|uniref:universal stress protein n=1 Tax=Paeniglutamicibacter sp. R2-26 TaxID=3144417 RepID=UPI003EE508D2
MSEKPVPQEDAEAIEGIVVGVDGSDQGLCALKWAAREAKRRGSVLNIVTAYTIPVFAASSMDAGYATLDDQLIRNGAEEVVRQARATVSEEGLTVRTYIESGDPSGVLLDLSRQAELIVVGTRGRGGFVGRLLGSVSSALPAHAKCPTVVVPVCVANRPEDDPEIQDRIVVGVDGSDRARMAVLVAAEMAASRGLSMRIVCALPPVSGALAWMPATVDQEAVTADVRHQMAIGKAWLQSYFPDLEIETDVVEGSPVEVLIRESQTSRLLVTGSRGRGGFAGMLLGSTSQGVLHHSKGPVMVVPDGNDPRLETRQQFEDKANGQ